MPVTINTIVTAMHGHARNCKKVDCSVCTANITAMREIPSSLLSEVLQDIKPHPLYARVLDHVGEKVFGTAGESRKAQAFLGSIGAQFDKQGRLRMGNP